MALFAKMANFVNKSLLGADYFAKNANFVKLSLVECMLSAKDLVLLKFRKMFDGALGIR